MGIITPEDLEKATPKIQEGDIVIINTGFHKNGLIQMNTLHTVVV